MPTAPLGNCRTARCGGRAVRSGYCRACQAGYERSRRASKALYSSAEWRAVRAAYLRAHPDCCECGDRATQVDHVKAVQDGGARFEWSNLRGYCRRHHSAKTAREDGRWGVRGSKTSEGGLSLGRSAASLVRPRVSQPKAGIDRELTTGAGARALETA